MVRTYIPTSKPNSSQPKPQPHDSTIAVINPANGSVTPKNVPTHAIIFREVVNSCFGGGRIGVGAVMASSVLGVRGRLVLDREAKSVIPQIKDHGLVAGE
jgi:hypothetical protein